MSGISRIVNTSFWTDEKTVNDFSPEDKYFFLYLLTNPHTTQLGIYKLVPKIAAFELGYSVESVMCLLERFQFKYDIIRFSKRTSEIAIKNYLRYSIVKGGKPVKDCLRKEEKQVKDKSLLSYIYNSIYIYDNLNITVKEFLEDIDIYINDNDNDNDNERIVNESCDESSPSDKKNRKFIPPTVEEVDAYCLEKGLEYVNPQAFVDFYGSIDWKVGKNKMSNWHCSVSGWNARSRDNGGKKYNRPKQVVSHEVFTDRPNRWKTCPESLWAKLKPFASNDGTFNYSDFDPSVLTENERSWMAANDM